jgi:hypothetical protein
MQGIIWIAATTGLLGSGPAHATVSAAANTIPPAAAFHADSGAATPGPALPAFLPSVQPALTTADTADAQRPRAVEYSDAYYTRLLIHRYTSLAMVPLFVAEYFVGRSLYNNPTTSSRSLRSAHTALAQGMGALFAVNTVTGVWNLWEGRTNPAGRVRRYLHGGLMMAAGAGFVATAMLAPHEREFRQFGGTAPDPGSANLHRGLAISSMGVTLASAAMMLIWRH